MRKGSSLLLTHVSIDRRLVNDVMRNVGSFAALLCNVLAELCDSPLCLCPFSPLHDFFAISRVLPTVPRMRLSCILCT